MRRDAEPQPTQLLRTMGSFSRRKKNCATRPVPPWDVPLLRRPLPTTVGSDPTPPDRMPLLPRFHKALSHFSTDLPRTLGLCPAQQLDLCEVLFPKC